jgi:Tol biopolymer transport system component
VSSPLANETTEPQLIRQELARILSSTPFTEADRLQRFLSFVVEESLEGRGTRLKESVIGVEVFGRSPGYDPKLDPIVRVQARRLRTKLGEYYDALAASAGLEITLPKGGYAPGFVRAAPVASATSPATEEAPFLPAPAPPPPAVALPRRRFRLALVLAPLVLAAFGVFLWAKFAGHADTQSPRVFTAYAGYQTDPAYSPDGKTIAFVWSGVKDEYNNIYVQPLDADSPRQLTTTRANESKPVWLQDGARIAFLRLAAPGRRLVVIASILNGGEQVVADLRANSADQPSIQWSRDGKHLYASERPAADAPSQIVDIELASGIRRVLTHPPAGTGGDDSVALSPDGQSIAFRRVSESAVHDILITSVKGGQERPLTRDRSGVMGCAWTRDGRALIVSSRRRSSLQTLWRFPVDGSEPVRLTDPTEAASLPVVSPRDGQIAYTSRFLDANIWRIDLDKSDSPHRLIATNLLESCPHYSPDGGRIAFRSNRTGNDELWVAGADGESPSRVTNFAGPVTGNARWSPDGRLLAVDSRPYGNSDVFLIPAGGGHIERFTRDPSNEVLPSFSADGKFVYFASDRSRRWQVWKQPVAGGEPFQVTREGGFAPLESSDGKWLYYAKLDAGGLYRMPVEGGVESLLVESLPASLWGGWGVTGDRIFYLKLTADAPTKAQLISLPLDTRKPEIVARLPFSLVLWDGSLGISSVGNHILVAEAERAGSEIRLRYIP